MPTGTGANFCYTTPDVWALCFDEDIAAGYIAHYSTACYHSTYYKTVPSTWRGLYQPFLSDETTEELDLLTDGDLATCLISADEATRAVRMFKAELELDYYTQQSEDVIVVLQTTGNSTGVFPGCNATGNSALILMTDERETSSGACQPFCGLPQGCPYLGHFASDGEVEAHAFKCFCNENRCWRLVLNREAVSNDFSICDIRVFGNYEYIQ